METFEFILEQILHYAPTVVAVIVAISTVVSSIKNIGKTKDEAVGEIKRIEITQSKRVTELTEQLNEVIKLNEELMRDNRELRENLNEVLLDKHKIYRREHKRGE